MKTTHFLGRTSEGERVWVDIELSRHPAGGHVTTEHKMMPADSSFYRLSISGHTKEFRRRSGASGQIQQTVMNMAFDSEAKLAPGWTHMDVAQLAAIWAVWHLNDVKAACAHMTDLLPGGSYEDNKHVTCPITGYRYGAKWLLAPLPDGVIKEVERFQAMPTGEPFND